MEIGYVRIQTTTHNTIITVWGTYKHGFDHLVCVQISMVICHCEWFTDANFCATFLLFLHVVRIS